MPVVDLLHPLPALLVLLPLRHQLLDVNTLIGKEMVGVMMVTTMQDVNGMEVIAVEMMLKPLIVKSANALIPLLAAALLLSPLDVNSPTGKVMVGVMMATTMLDVPLMEVIVVEIM